MTPPQAAHSSKDDVMSSSTASLSLSLSVSGSGSVSGSPLTMEVLGSLSDALKFMEKIIACPEDARLRIAALRIPVDEVSGTRGYSGQWRASPPSSGGGSGGGEWVEINRASGTGRDKDRYSGISDGGSDGGGRGGGYGGRGGGRGAVMMRVR